MAEIASNLGGKKKTATKKTAKATAKKPKVQKVCISCPPGREGQPFKNFYTSKNPLHAEGCVPICKTCIVEKCYNTDTEEVDLNELKKILRQIDRPFIQDAYDASLNQYNDAYLGQNVRKDNRSKILGYYFKNINSLDQYSNMTWEDGLKYERRRETFNKIEAGVKPVEEVVIPKHIVAMFGSSFEVEEYEILESHYNMLKDRIDPNDAVQETLVRDLCAMRVQQSRALASGDSDRYEKAAKLYQATIASANLKPKDSAKGSDDAKQRLDMWIRDIEQYAPCEYFADKQIYGDFDKVREYWERFLVRPFKNLFGGTNEMDFEHKVDDGEETNISS